AIETYYSHPELGRRPRLGVEIFLAPACLAMKLVPPLEHLYYRQWNTVYRLDNIHHPHWWRLKH
ncbi:MAG TPA: hypothetical protein VG733_20020, partial [Chthoniobacteraceae bacterium]|nr:hypothetical protein [Chthoniobacteraceae bacterium]